MQSFIKIICLLLCLALTSCSKYLEYPSDKKLSVITKLEDLQALLDQYFTVNHTDPCMGEPASDNVYMDKASWESIDQYERSLYVWEPFNVVWPYSHYGSGNGWSLSYDIVYKANVVIENLDKFEHETGDLFNDIKGQAHFLRGKSFLQVAWIWSLAYNESDAFEHLGIPLRLSSDFNIASLRSNLYETYQQVIGDLALAASLLPEVSTHPYRASKAAAYGYLSRVYLSMRNYRLAELYADSCLMINNKLLDLNKDLDLTKNFPFPPLNAEVVYVSKMGLSMGLSLSKIDSTLYKAYDSNDLRKVGYFRANDDGSYRFRGSYDGSSRPFTGITTGEMYLTSIEAKIRNKKNEEAIGMLDHFLSTRWISGTYIPLDSNIDVLNKVLEERRKELVMRDLRWMDIKRLNMEGADISQIRRLDDVEYTLPSNDLRYAMAIPEDLVQRTGIVQNPR